MELWSRSSSTILSVTITTITPTYRSSGAYLLLSYFQYLWYSYHPSSNKLNHTVTYPYMWIIRSLFCTAFSPSRNSCSYSLMSRILSKLFSILAWPEPFSLDRYQSCCASLRWLTGLKLNAFDSATLKANLELESWMLLAFFSGLEPCVGGTWANLIGSYPTLSSSSSTSLLSK